jgi:hypothetical protein
MNPAATQSNSTTSKSQKGARNRAIDEALADIPAAEASEANVSLGAAKRDKRKPKAQGRPLLNIANSHSCHPETPLSMRPSPFVAEPIYKGHIVSTIDAIILFESVLAGVRASRRDRYPV